MCQPFGFAWKADLSDESILEAQNVRSSNAVAYRAKVEERRSILYYKVRKGIAVMERQRRELAERERKKDKIDKERREQLVVHNAMCKREEKKSIEALIGRLKLMP